jgi:hypothetical protein
MSTKQSEPIEQPAPLPLQKDLPAFPASAPPTPPAPQPIPQPTPEK